MKKIIPICMAFAFTSAFLLGGCGSSNAETENDSANTSVQTENDTASVTSAEGALADGTYTTAALTTHYAASCLAGVDYDSLFDVTFEVKDGVFTSITLDIGENAKAVPETADISMEDWPFIKLSENQANSNLVGEAATTEAILEAWQIENREELAKEGIDVTSGATEACRAVRDAIVNTTAMQENGYTYASDYSAKDAVSELKLFDGKITGETALENGRTQKNILINDGEYTLFGLVSANNNEIDNTAVDYNYILRTDVTVSGGIITAITCSTPNGSEESQTAVAEASELASATFVGKEATNTTISGNLLYDAENDSAFTGTVGAKIACDMIDNCLQNGCTHIIGWSY